MKRISGLLVGLFIIIIQSFGQGRPPSNVVYIIDSIPVIEDPEQGNEIVDGDIADVTVIKNKDTLRSLGYDQFDGAIYVFTKQYRSRSENVKLIPSSRQMERKSGVWHHRGKPFTGPVIDYYYNGCKQGEGTLKDGKLEGLRRTFYQNGNVSTERTYSSGIVNGLGKEFFERGVLRQKGEFNDGRENGLWESYYPNGQVKLRSTYLHGELVDSAFKYYSNGKIKERVSVENGKVTSDPLSGKISQLLAKSNESNKEGDVKSAIKWCSKVIALDSTYADAYFSRGTLKLNDFRFDEAIADFDKALSLEPFMEVAYANRAFARIRKHQFANSRQLPKSNGVTALASKDDPGIPGQDLSLICADLNGAILLGNKGKMIMEAVSAFCGATSRR